MQGAKVIKGELGQRDQDRPSSITRWRSLGGRCHQDPFIFFSFVFSWLLCVTNSLLLRIGCNFSTSNALLTLV